MFPCCLRAYLDIHSHIHTCSKHFFAVGWALSKTCLNEMLNWPSGCGAPCNSSRDYRLTARLSHLTLLQPPADFHREEAGRPRDSNSPNGRHCLWFSSCYLVGLVVLNQLPFPSPQRLAGSEGLRTGCSLSRWEQLLGRPSPLTLLPIPPRCSLDQQPWHHPGAC